MPNPNRHPSNTSDTPNAPLHHTSNIKMPIPFDDDIESPSEETLCETTARIVKKIPDLADDPANALKEQFGEAVEKGVYTGLGATQTFMHASELYEAYGRLKDGEDKKVNIWIMLLAATGLGFAITLFTAGLSSLVPALSFLASGILIQMDILFLVSSSLMVNIFFAKFALTFHKWREGKKIMAAFDENPDLGLKDDKIDRAAENNIALLSPKNRGRIAIHNATQLIAASLILTCNMLMQFVPALDITIFTTMGIPLSPPALIAMMCSLIGMTNELLRETNLNALKERFQSFEPHLLLKVIAALTCLACIVLDAFPLNLPSVPFLNISLPAAVFLVSVAVVISDLIVMAVAAYRKKTSNQHKVEGDSPEGSVANKGLAFLSASTSTTHTPSHSSKGESSDASPSGNPAALLDPRNPGNSSEPEKPVLPGAAHNPQLVA